MSLRSLLAPPALPDAPTMPLHRVAYEGDVPALAALLAEGGDPNLLDERQRTPLMWASLQGHTETARALLKWGANVNAPGPRNRTALSLAVSQGQAEIIRLLLQNGANREIYIAPEPDEPITPEAEAEMRQFMALHEEGLTDEERIAFEEERAEFRRWEQEYKAKPKKPKRVRLLHAAILSGNPDALLTLLEGGFDPDDPESDYAERQMRPLDFATTFDDLEMLRLLLRFGADPNGAGAGAAALVSAIMRGNIEMVRLLLDAGADPNRAADDMPPVAFALSQGKTEIAALLVERGATFTGMAGIMVESLIEDDAKETLAQKRGTDWHAAVLAGDVEGVRAALDRGADVNVPGETDAAGLLLAAKRGTLPLVELLLERGANAEATNRHGANALHYAAQTDAEDGPQIVRLLARRGVDAEAVDQFGFTPVILAALRDVPGMIDALREGGASVGLADAALIGDADAVRGFIDAGIAVDAPNTHGMTALMGAAARNDFDLVRYLLSQGADVNAREQTPGTPPDSGRNALNYAVSRGHENAAQVLLDAGADINLQAGRQTPLMQAAMKGDAAMVRFLLQRGASVRDDSPKKSELDGLMHGTLWAEAEHRHLPAPEILPLLLEAGLPADTRGASTDLLGKRPGDTALAVVLKKGLPEPYAQVLLRYGADPNVRQNGKSLLMETLETDDLEKVRRLLDWGADPNRGENIVNPLDAALAREDDALIALLRERGAVCSERLATSDITAKTRESLLLMHSYHARKKAKETAPPQVGVIEMTDGPNPVVRMTRKWDARRAATNGTSDNPPAAS